MTRLLLVHGAFHGAWCWDKLRPELTVRGIEHEVVELPFTTPDDDVATVRAAVDLLSKDGHPVTLLGHSFGGAVISAAAADDGAPYPGVAALVYLTAIMVAPDQSVDFSGCDAAVLRNRYLQRQRHADSGIRDLEHLEQLCRHGQQRRERSRKRSGGHARYGKRERVRRFHLRLDDPDGRPLSFATPEHYQSVSYFWTIGYRGFDFRLEPGDWAGK